MRPWESHARMSGHLEHSLSPSALAARLATLGRELGQREAEHGEGLERARKCVEELRAEVAAALDGFHREAASAGAPHLRVEISPVRVDDKHLRSVEFELVRGRHRAIVTAKSRGDVTFVGPFKSGKTEGPCKSFPIDARDEVGSALADFLEGFLEEAATP
jgi:hypothetical protein